LAATRWTDQLNDTAGTNRRDHRVADADVDPRFVLVRLDQRPDLRPAIPLWPVEQRSVTCDSRHRFSGAQPEQVTHLIYSGFRNVLDQRWPSRDRRVRFDLRDRVRRLLPALVGITGDGADEVRDVVFRPACVRESAAQCTRRDVPTAIWPVLREQLRG